MKKIFSASILLLSLAGTVLKAGYPPIPDPTKIPPASIASASIVDVTPMRTMIKGGLV